MPTYAEMFGGKNYVKVKNEGDKFVALFKDYGRVPQTDIKSKNNLWLIQENDGEKWKRVEEDTFDKDEVHNCFQLKQLVLYLELDGVDWEWTLSDSAEDAFKDAMKDAGGIDPGDTVGGLLFDASTKPYKWRFQIKRQGSE